MSYDFREDFANPHTDPMDGQSYEFNWKGLYEELGEADLESEDYVRLVFAFRVLLDWIIQPNRQHPTWEHSIARRILALTWTLNPGLFDDCPSLTQLASRLGVHKTAISPYAAEARRHFGVRNRAQSHAWNWQHSSAADAQKEPRKPSQRPGAPDLELQLFLPFPGFREPGHAGEAKSWNSPRLHLNPKLIQENKC